MIIFNKILPPKGFKAMAIFPFIFVRGNSIDKKIINHEKIHFAQQKELLIVGFYILYGIFYLIYGYRDIPFEREAYRNADNPDYLKKRKPFAWLKHLT